MEVAESVPDWVALVRRNCASAHALLKQKITANAWNDAGFAVECALKAAIMRNARFNSWPTKGSRPDLHTHLLHHLIKEAGIVLSARDPIAHKWQTVLLWRRSDTYVSKPMPFKVASDMVEAACGPGGVIECLNTRYHLDI
jgi:hypothetical protein